MSYLNYKEGDFLPQWNKRLNVLIQANEDFFVFLDENEVVQWEIAKTYGDEPHDLSKVLQIVAELEDLPNKHLNNKQKKYLQLQLAESVARTLSSRSAESALVTLSSAKEFLIETCRQNVKRWLLSAGLITLIVIGVVALLLEASSSRIITWGLSNEALTIIKISLTGGLGAFVSLFLRTDKVTSNFYSTEVSIYFEGVIRTIYGIVGASIVVLCIKSNLLLGVFNSKADNEYILFFLAAISGASERLMPFLIDNVEKKFNTTKGREDENKNKLTS